MKRRLISKGRRIGPVRSVSCYNLGNAWLEMGRTGKSHSPISESLGNRPGFARAYNNLGIALLRLSRTNEAVANFQKAIEVESDPDFADAYNNLANLLAAQNRQAEAIEHYQKAIRINPDFAEARCGLADLLAAQGRLDEAIGQYQKVVQIKPDYTAAHYNLGVVLARLARLDEAAAHFRKVIQLSPSYPPMRTAIWPMCWSGRVNWTRRSRNIIGRWRWSPIRPRPITNWGLHCKHNATSGRRSRNTNGRLRWTRHVPAHLGLAWLLATSPDPSLRNGEKALTLVNQARALAGIDSPQLLDTLAAACASGAVSRSG